MRLGLPDQKKIGFYSVLSGIFFFFPCLLLLFHWEINSAFNAVCEPGWE